jgi:hypothetical protein
MLHLQISSPHIGPLALPFRGKQAGTGFCVPEAGPQELISVNVLVP